MKFYLYVFLLLAGSWCAHSQNTISGRVTASGKQPLDGAHIHIEQLHGVSNPDGYYEVHGITPGRHRVVVSYIGYKSLDTIIDISGNMLLDASLTPEATRLEEVVLTQAATPQTVAHEQRLRAETIERYSNASLGDALREIAGVNALKTGSNIVKPVINGLHSSRVPVIANNVRLEDQQWGAEHAPNLDVNAAGHVSVIKGAGALQYGGDAIGGLVLVEPVQVLKDMLFGRSLLTLDSNGRGGSLSSSVHKGAEKGWAWNASGTLKCMGDRRAPDYVLSNTGNREGNLAGDIKFIGNSYTLSASYSFYNATIGIAKATHIGNVADLVDAINNREPSIIHPFTYDIDVPRQEVQHHLAKISYDKDLADNGSLSLQYALQLNNRKEYDIRRGEYKNIPALDLTLATHSLQANWRLKQDKVSYKAGANASAQFNDASPDTDVMPLIPTYDKYDAGAYGIASYFFTDTFSAEAGLRYDFSHMNAVKYYQESRWESLGYDRDFGHLVKGREGTQLLTNPQFSFHNISASLGIRQNFSNGYSLLANAGLAMRNPNPAELFSDGLHHSNGTIELGDLRTDTEKAIKLSATVLKSGDKFSFEVTPYLSAINNFIYLSPTGVEYTNRGAFPVYSYLQDNAVLAGIDVHSDWDISRRLRHSLNFAYVHGTNTATDEPLIDMPPANLTNTLRYSGNWHNVFMELRSEAAFRQGRYPDNNFYTDVPRNGVLVRELVDISTPPAGYHLLHFTSGMQFPLGKTTASINVTVFNIFNTAYRDYLNRQRLYVDEVGRNFQIQLKFNY